MNRVLAAERKSQAELVEARTRAEVNRIAADQEADARRRAAEADADIRKRQAEAEAAARTIHVNAERAAVKSGEEAAVVYAKHPALLRLKELETLQMLAKNANARINIGFDKHTRADSDES